MDVSVLVAERPAAEGLFERTFRRLFGLPQVMERITYRDPYAWYEPGIPAYLPFPPDPHV